MARNAWLTFLPISFILDWITLLAVIRELKSNFSLPYPWDTDGSGLKLVSPLLSLTHYESANATRGKWSHTLFILLSQIRSENPASLIALPWLQTAVSCMLSSMYNQLEELFWYRLTPHIMSRTWRIFFTIKAIKVNSDLYVAGFFSSMKFQFKYHVFSQAFPDITIRNCHLILFSVI